MANVSRLIDASRLSARIARLAEFTEPERPFTRRAFTDVYATAREWLAAEFRAAGLEVHLDAAANLIGARAGTDPAAGTIMLGSHIDTVTGGGRFDGIAGVIAGLEVAQALAEAGITMRHRLSVVDFLAEEPSDYGTSCTGSRALAGNLSAEQLAFTNPAGETLADAIARMGGEPDKLTAPLLKRGEIAAYLELHIEQGPVLEAEGKTIGIVSGIAGIQRRRVVIGGRAGHAGTVPMNMRADALVGAAAFVRLVWDEAQKEAAQSQFVATVGRFDVQPNDANVVPGRVGLVLEARSMDDARTEAFLETVAAAGRDACGELGLTLKAEPQSFAAAVHCDVQLRQLLSGAAQARGFGQLELVSGAGHDAMQVAHVAPVGMIFVPCEGGISHHPAENARTGDIAAGTEVLLDTVLALDQAAGGGER